MDAGAAAPINPELVRISTARRWSSSGSWGGSSEGVVMHVGEETSDHYRELYHFELALYPRLEWRDDVERVGGLTNVIEEVEGGYYMLIEVHTVLALFNLKHLALVFSPVKK